MSGSHKKILKKYGIRINIANNSSNILYFKRVKFYMRLSKLTKLIKKKK